MIILDHRPPRAGKALFGKMLWVMMAVLEELSNFPYGAAWMGSNTLFTLLKDVRINSTHIHSGGRDPIGAAGQISRWPRAGAGGVP